MTAPTPDPRLVAFIGDIHGHFKRMADTVAALPDSVTRIFQVGDMGLYPPHLVSEDCWFVAPPRTVEYIDGNHEDFTILRDIASPTELRPNLVYLPRGTVLDVEGLKIGFLGGAESRDHARRTEGTDWFEYDEKTTVRDAWKFSHVEHLDILVTHAPPRWAMLELFPNEPVENLPSSQVVEQVWEGFGRPTLICGHVHPEKTGAMYHPDGQGGPVYVVAIDDALVIDPKTLQPVLLPTRTQARKR